MKGTSPVVSALVIPALLLMLGVWEKGGQVSALPGWFWLVLPALALLAAGSSALMRWGVNQSAAWVRVLAVGGGWGVLMIATMGSITRLEGHALDWVFFGVWTVAALVFGLIFSRSPSEPQSH